MLLQELGADDDWRSQDSQTVRFAAIFKALGDPIRLRILSLVATSSEPVAATDLLPYVGISQPTVSHHVRALVQAGLITSTKQGTYNVLEVVDDKLQEVVHLLELPRKRSKKSR